MPALQSQAEHTRTLSDLLHTTHTDLQHHTAVIIPDYKIELTYKQLQQQITGVQHQLLQYGIHEGDAICMSLVNSLEFTVSFLAITNLRCMVAPQNPSYRTDEFKFYLSDISSKAMLVHRKGDYSNATDEQHRQYAIQAARDVGAAVIEVYYDQQANAVKLQLVEHGKLQKSSSNQSKDVTQIKPQPSDVCLVLHTSGTTSKPKAVPLTHRSISASIRNIAATYHLTPQDRSYVVMPLFHVHGLIGALLTTFGVGGSVVIPPKFSANVHWQQFDQYQCTWYSAVPTIHTILLQHEQSHSSKGKRGKLRFIRSCSSPLSETAFHRLNDTYQVPICEAYAMTEASHQMTSNPLAPSPNAKQIVNSVGRPTGGVKLTVRDEHDKEVKQGGRGEICIKGENVTPGYLNNDTANKENFTASGWFRTGDQGYINDEGFVFLTGRLKEFINRGGEKISPIEVDNSLLSHPDIAEAVAFPCPSEHYGQEVYAAVVLKPAVRAKYKGKDKEVEQMLQKHAADKVAKFKVPKKIYITETMPKTATGKIQRRNVAAAFLKEGEQAEAPQKPKSKL